MAVAGGTPHLAERAALFPIIHDHAGAAALRRMHALLDAVQQVRPTRANVRAEDIRAVAPDDVNRASRRARAATMSSDAIRRAMSWR